jgi:hypothetical protein
MIYGQEDRDTYHALVTCLHARGLWHAMRQCWDLPGKDVIQRTGSDRILDLLPKLNNVFDGSHDLLEGVACSQSTNT